MNGEPTIHPDLDLASLGCGRRRRSARSWLQAKRRRRAGIAACDEYEREYGAFTPEELAQADAILDEHLGPERGRHGCGGFRLRAG